MPHAGIIIADSVALVDANNIRKEEPMQCYSSMHAVNHHSLITDCCSQVSNEKSLPPKPVPEMSLSKIPVDPVRSRNGCVKQEVGVEVDSSGWLQRDETNRRSVGATCCQCVISHRSPGDLIDLRRPALYARKSTD